MIDPASKFGLGVLAAAPTTAEELVETLRFFAARRVELLVVDGGDGTVRDVITAAIGVYGDDLPPIALSPSGKTNALALDVGVPLGWSIENAIAAWQTGRVVTRSPIEIVGAEGHRLRGFIFGAGGFVRATALAQRTHRIGVIDGLAVGLSLAGAIGQTWFGSSNNPWREGERVRIVSSDTGEVIDRSFYVLLGSTLQRLPLGVRPLGRGSPGLNVLAVDAPPRMLPLAVPAILTGREGGRWARLGYHHGHDISPVELTIKTGFILDGEHFPGGTFTLKAGPPLRFVVP
jgi:hypothetical protein